MEVADLYVTLRGVAADFNKSIAEAGVRAEESDGKIASLVGTTRTLALGTAAAAIGIGAATVAMASKFQASMEQIHTLAGVPQQALAGLSKGVLDLAGKVGTGPNSLAEALYHIESSFASTGISGANALELLKTAAEGAKIGGANLVDVTNALDAVVASGKLKVQDYSKAMGVMLAIVGSGDMTMQDFANATSTGMLSIASTFGASMKDIGAALATFGDLNIRGQVAATDLRMAIMDLTIQSPKGSGALQNLGISTEKLRKDLQDGGLNSALTYLHDGLLKVGITGPKVGQVLEEAFTKKSAAPLAILLDNFDRFQSKFPEMDRAANGFGDAWQSTLNTLKMRTDQVKAQFESWGIAIGQKLIPPVTYLLGKFEDLVAWFGKHKKVTQELTTVIKDGLIGALPVAAGFLTVMAVEAALAAARFIALSLAVGFVIKWLMNLYEHNARFRADVDATAKKVRAAWDAVVKWFQANWPTIERVAKEVINAVVKWVEKYGPKIWGAIKDTFETIKKVIGEVISAVSGFLTKHQKEISRIYDDVKKTLKSVGDAFAAVWDFIQAAVTTGTKIVEDLWSRFGEHLIQHVITAWHTIWNTIVGVLHGILQFLRGVFEIIKGVFDVFTGILTGKWSKVWQGIKEIFGGAWDAIVGVLKAAWALITGIVSAAVNVVSTVIGGAMAVISAAWDLVWHALGTAVSAAVDGIKTFVSNGLNWITDKFNELAGPWLTKGKDLINSFKNGITTAWTDVTTWFKGLPKAVTDAVGDLSQTLVAAGKAVLNGFLSGAKTVWNDITGFFSGIGGWISQHKGPIEFDRQLLVPHGMAIMAGFHQGLLTGFSSVQSSVSGMANGMADKFVSALPTGAAGSSVNSGGVHYHYHVTVQGSVVDNQGLMKAMQTAAGQHGRRNSLTWAPVVGR